MESKYNTFNGIKVLRYVDYWKPILKGKIPPPICVSIDPSGVCNFNCSFCNASKALSGTVMSIETMDKLVDVLKEWHTGFCCLGGGGSPLTNKNLPHLLHSLYENDIKIGMVTNGSLLHNFFQYAHMFEWIGISVDAATSETFAEIKGTKESMFAKVINNIQQLCNLNHTEVGFKFLVHPTNYKEIYKAVKLAKDIGCDLIQIRPAGNTWFGDVGCNFTEDMIKQSLEHVKQAKADFEDSKFKVYGMTYKFDKNWSTKKSFKRCYAMYTTCYISPEGKIGLCFDRRGDKNIELCSLDTYKLWGSQKHISICNHTDVSKCPRCTGTHINEVFENVIIEDKMSCGFY